MIIKSINLNVINNYRSSKIISFIFIDCLIKIISFYLYRLSKIISFIFLDLFKISSYIFIDFLDHQFIFIDFLNH